MKIILNKYGGLQTIQDREILVQGNDNANYLDVFYLNENGQLADNEINLVTAMFRRSDGFVIGEIILTEHTNAEDIKFWRFEFTNESGTLACAGEIEITIRLKVARIENDKILYTRQRTSGLIVGHVMKAVVLPDEYNAYEARIFELESKVALLLSRLSE